jgi:hypothetical protein
MTNAMESTENCGVCGKELIYGTGTVSVKCDFCRKTAQAQIYCPDGHYVCDNCHSQKALGVLREVLKYSTSTDPAELLERVMSHPAVPMHGPEHHAIVPAVIVAAVKNSGYPVPEGAMEKAIERGPSVPGGWCGLYGACGAAIGVGIAVSVLTAATPLTGPARTLANEATALALGKMLDGGPRCCKRASRKAIEAAVDFLKKHLDISLEIKAKPVCNYSERNKECLLEDCSYYKSGR